MKIALITAILFASVAFSAPTTLHTARLEKRILPGSPSEVAPFAGDNGAAAFNAVAGAIALIPASKGAAETEETEYEDSSPPKPPKKPTAYPFTSSSAYPTASRTANPPVSAKPTAYPSVSPTTYPPARPTSYPPESPTSYIPPKPTGPVGGIGGIDPNSGLPLIPVADPSNFCQESGQQYSDGSQRKEGSCSSTPQGQIPSVWHMVSTLILEPANDAVIGLGESFNVVIVNRNLATGYFDNPETEFYTQPQGLDSGGNVRGHQHVTVQFLGDAYSAPEANEVEFFKGLNDAADEQGRLSVNVPEGTIVKPGLHRICSMAGAFAHQPVIMPVAKRGAQDDCIRIHVG